MLSGADESRREENARVSQHSIFNVQHVTEIFSRFARNDEAAPLCCALVATAEGRVRPG